MDETWKRSKSQPNITITKGVQLLLTYKKYIEPQNQQLFLEREQCIGNTSTGNKVDDVVLKSEDLKKGSKSYSL